MNVALPKTIADPWTIPWAMISNIDADIAAGVIAAIHRFMRAEEEANHLPTEDLEAWGVTQFSVAELLQTLEQLAIDKGAATAKATENGCHYGNDFIGKRVGGSGKGLAAYTLTGFLFRVSFTTPGGKHYRTDIRFWFDSKRRTVYD